MKGLGGVGRGQNKGVGEASPRKVAVGAKRQVHAMKSLSIGSFTLPPLPRLRSSLSPKLSQSPVIRKATFVPASPERPSLGNYRLLRTIGTGSFSRVRLAVHRTTQEVAAIKMMPKQEIVRKRQVEHVRNERQILEEVNHPFIARFQAAFQDKEKLYLVQEFVAGGELYRVLRSKGRLAVREAKFYASEVVSAIIYIHSRKIAYRDIKPENLLISSTGHIKIVDFGFAKHLYGSEKTFTLCGTPEYLAPEVIQQRGHDMTCDWWGLGVLLFEMLTGHAPYMDQNPIKLYEKIINTPIVFPGDIDSTAKSLIAGLTEKMPVRRLQESGILRHDFFSGLDWSAVEAGEQRPPFVPNLRGPEDAGNFEVYDEEQEPREKVPVTFDMFPNF